MNGTLYFNADVGNEEDRQKVLQEFNKIASISEKITYAGSKVNKIVRQDREDSLTTDAAIRQQKNNEQSKRFRIEGNKLLRSRKFATALEMYNKSICYALTNSEDLAFGYANRSLVYLELQNYLLCLENICLAKECGYPDRLMVKLKSRELKCFRRLNEISDDCSKVPPKLKLSFPSHQNVPFIANCLVLQENKKFGRHIKTNVNLEVGQVVAIEESYAAILNEELKYQRCANCLLENEFNLMPCDHCVCSMYCSTKCSIDAQWNYHRIECPIIDFLSSKWDDVDHIAVRTCLRAMTSFSNLDQLQQFLEESRRYHINGFTLNYRDNVPSSELFQAIHTLSTNQDKRTTSEVFDFAALTSVLCERLMSFTPLGKLLNEEKYRKMFVELIFRHLQIASINKGHLEHKRYELINGVAKFNSVVYGCATYGLSSLINHACSPNVIRLSYGRCSAVIACRPLKAGDQLFLNYT